MARLSEAEWRVMNVVWNHAPVSTRDVLEHVEDETQWAYTTVKTVLDRLVWKKILTVRKRANTVYYEPLVTREDAQHTAVDGLLDRAFDGAFGPMVHFLVGKEKLSAKERQELITLLEEEEESDGLD